MAATVLDAIAVRELQVKEIKKDFIIQLSSERATTGGVTIKDSVGFTVARIDSSGNFHIRGDVLKDL